MSFKETFHAFDFRLATFEVHEPPLDCREPHNVTITLIHPAAAMGWPVQQAVAEIYEVRYIDGHRPQIDGPHWPDHPERGHGCIDRGTDAWTDRPTDRTGPTGPIGV